MDRLLGGGWALGYSALVWGKGGSGKSRAVLRWASHMGPALVLTIEMPRELCAETAASAGANLDNLFLLEELNGWRTEAERIGACAVMLDSISVCGQQQVTVLRELADWAQRSKGFVWAICHMNKRGRLKGPSDLEHWPDYSVQFVPRPGGVALMRIGKSRFNAPGSAKVRLVA